MRDKPIGKAARSARRRVVLVAALLLALWLAMLVFGAGGLDRVALHALYAGHRPALAVAAHVVTIIGGGYVLTVVTLAGAAFLLIRKHKRRALALVFGSLVGRLLVELQKYEIGRLRPEDNPHLVVVHNLSFPSGHSANSMLVYLPLALLLVDDPTRRRRWVAAALLSSGMIGISRIVLGVHYPSDVIGGWAFGLMWAMIMLWIVRREERAA
jgi:undecaprenyl-diphosphatase